MSSKNPQVIDPYVGPAGPVGPVAPVVPVGPVGPVGPAEELGSAVVVTEEIAVTSATEKKLSTSSKRIELTDDSEDVTLEMLEMTSLALPEVTERTTTVVASFPDLVVLKNKLTEVSDVYSVLKRAEAGKATTSVAVLINRNCFMNYKYTAKEKGPRRSLSSSL